MTCSKSLPSLLIDLMSYDAFLNDFKLPRATGLYDGGSWLTTDAKVFSAGIILSRWNETGGSET